MPIADEIRHCLETAIVPGDLALPFHYPPPDQWETWQGGFRWNAVTGENLVAATPGAWQPGWYVLARNYFDDPFFVDFDEAALGYPVYYAPHGAGRWQAERIAPSVQAFVELLTALRDCDEDDAAALRLIDAETDPRSELWREVRAERQNREPEAEPAPVDLADWQHGRLIVTAVGARKMQVVQALRQILKLSPQQTLALTAQPEIVVAEGHRLHLHSLQSKLQDLGAAVAFRADTRADR